MYYRRQGEAQMMFGEHDYQPYFRENFTILSNDLTQTQKYFIWFLVAAILILLVWLLYKQYGYKLRGRDNVSIFY